MVRACWSWSVTAFELLHSLSSTAQGYTRIRKYNGVMRWRRKRRRRRRRRRRRKKRNRTGVVGWIHGEVPQSKHRILARPSSRLDTFSVLSGGE